MAKKNIIDRICDAIKEWRKQCYLNARVNLITLTFNEEREEYTMEYTVCKRRDLPLDAVHVTKKKGYYFVDMTSKDAVPVVNHPQCTAVDVNLFMENNSITDALKMQWMNGSPLDMKKVLVIAVIGIIVCVIVMNMMK